MAFNSQIQTSSVFLVSGGGRGITAQCVLKLATYFPCKWILLGRSEILEIEPSWARDCQDEAELKKRIMQDFLAQGQKPTPMAVNRVHRSLIASREIQQTLKALKELGSEATYVSVDVTDTAALPAKLSPIVKRFGPVTGIIHGAGNLADKLIENKTPEDFERVYGPKILGLENLLHCVSLKKLKHLVLFSSVAGFYGNAGQADYALANEILNKAALLVKQKAPSCHVVAINWGPWESGMVTPILKQAFEQRGITILPIDAATQMLVNELAPKHQDTVQVVIGSPLPSLHIAPSPELQTHRLKRRLDPNANPFLQDHVISGMPVLPFTCSISWMANACEQLYPGYQCFICEDIRVLKGIVFDQDAASEYVLDLQEVSKDKEKIVVTGKIWSAGPTRKTRYHFSNKLTLQREKPAAPTLECYSLAPDHMIPMVDKEFYQVDASSLFHGPTFHGIRRILNITPEAITAECLAPGLGDRHQGQFPVGTINPYVSDIQTHAVWIWLQHFHRSMCLPAQVGRFQNFSSPPFDKPFYTTTEVVSKTKTRIVTNITSHDDQGNIYTSIQGAEATILPSISQAA